MNCPTCGSPVNWKDHESRGWYMVKHGYCATCKKDITVQESFNSRVSSRRPEYDAVIHIPVMRAEDV